MQRSTQLPANARTPLLQQRDLALGLGSLLLHALVLFLLPGLAIPQANQPPLLVRLVQLDLPIERTVRDSLPPEPASPPLTGLDTQVPAGMGARSLDPQDGQAAVRRSSPGSNPKPSKPAGAAGQPVPRNDPGPQQLAPGPEETTPTVEGDTTDVVKPSTPTKPAPAKPITTPAKPQPAPVTVPPPPAEPPAKPGVQPETKPPSEEQQPAAAPSKSAPRRQAAKNNASKSAKTGTDRTKQGKGDAQGRPDVTGAPGIAKPAPQTGKPDSTPNTGNGSGPSPNPGNGSGLTPGAPDGNGPEGRTAPDFGAPALPKGPGDGELAILGKYGDHCMDELRKMARNPEKAREKFKNEKDDWGTVTFEFEVTRTGKLLSINILNNGGYAPFGEEVAEAMRICGRTGKFGPWSRYGSVPSVESWTFKRKLKFPLY